MSNRVHLNGNGSDRRKQLRAALLGKGDVQLHLAAGLMVERSNSQYTDGPSDIQITDHREGVGLFVAFRTGIDPKLMIKQIRLLIHEKRMDEDFLDNTVFHEEIATW